MRTFDQAGQFKTSALAPDTGIYFLLLGRAGGQIAYGGTAASQNLTLGSTANATKGFIYLGAASGFDETNVRLGIGTAAPGTLGHFTSSANAAAILKSVASAAGTAASGQVAAVADTNSVTLATNSSTFTGTTFGITAANYSSLINTGTAGFLIGTNGAAPLVLGTNNTERARFLSTGELGIGGSPTASTKLHIIETANAQLLIRIDSQSTGNAANASYNVRCDTAAVRATAYSTTFTTTTYYGFANVQNWCIVDTNTTAAGLLLGTQGAFPVVFGTNNADRGRVDSVGNLCWGAGAAAGTTAAGVIALKNGTAPTTSPATTVQLWSAATAANNANLYARNEAGYIEQITGKRYRAGGDVTWTSNTTLSTVTGLSTNVEAGKTYTFRAVLFTTSANTGGIKAAIAGTCTATSIVYQGCTTELLTVAANSRSSALGTAVGAVTAVTVAVVYIDGTITVNAAGTLLVQAAQNASSGSATTVLRGSYFEVLANP